MSWKEKFNSNVNKLLKIECEVLREWDTPVDCKIRGPLQKPHQLLTVRIQGRSSNDFGRGRKWVSICNMPRHYTLKKVYSPGKKQLARAQQRKEFHFQHPSTFLTYLRSKKTKNKNTLVNMNQALRKIEWECSNQTKKINLKI